MSGNGIVARKEKGRNNRGIPLLVVLGSLIGLGQVANMIIMHGKANISTQDGTPPLVVQHERKMVITNTKKEELPKWISNYFDWHKEMRAKFPGKELFTNPNAPKLLIRVCLGLCGGLNDRLGQLPWDLYLANQTKRVLLIGWCRPRELENFLLPNDVDWRIPVAGWGFDDMKAVRQQTRLFADMPEANPDQNFTNVQVDLAIERANTGEFKDEKILVHRILGHIIEENLEKRLAALGETDMIHDTLTFGRIFRAFFKPSPAVQQQIDQVNTELNLTPGQYSAVHCRVRHPKATPPGKVVIGKSGNYPADKTGLPFHGEYKEFAIRIATHAIQCARTLILKGEPVYFFADSNDLVQFMVHDMKNEELLARNASFLENEYDKAAQKAVAPTHIVAREMSEENAHIDKQKGREAPAYFATFVDLYLAMGARCMTYGIGYYAVFASKLSGIKCKLVYQKEEWGGQASKRAQVCTEETYKHLA